MIFLFFGKEVRLGKDRLRKNVRRHELLDRDGNVCATFKITIERSCVLKTETHFDKNGYQIYLYVETIMDNTKLSLYREYYYSKRYISRYVKQAEIDSANGSFLPSAYIEERKGPYYEEKYRLDMDDNEIVYIFHGKDLIYKDGERYMA